MQRRFNTKNLLVQVRKRPGLAQEACLNLTACHLILSGWMSMGCCLSGCKYVVTPDPCGRITPLPCDLFTPDPCGIISPVVEDPRDLLTNPEALGVLKQHLKDALEDITRHEAALAERMRPQTMEEVDELEKELKGALEELQSRRNELRGKTG